jgi:hypothetical protein
VGSISILTVSAQGLAQGTDTVPFFIASVLLYCIKTEFSNVRFSGFGS